MTSQNDTNNSINEFLEMLKSYRVEPKAKDNHHNYNTNQ